MKYWRAGSHLPQGFPWLLLSPALLICSQGEPGCRHSRSRARFPLTTGAAHTTHPEGQRQTGRQGASAASGARAERGLLPRSTVGSDEGLTLKPPGFGPNSARRRTHNAAGFRTMREVGMISASIPTFPSWD